MALVNRVRVVWTGVAGTPAYTNLFAINGSPTVAAFHAAVSSYINSLRPLVSATVLASVEGDVALIDTATDQVVGVQSLSTINWGGTGSGNMLPTSNQILVRWLTGTYLGGRQIRGRTYIPYIVAANQSALGQVTTGAQTTSNNAASAYLTAVPGACVYSRKNGVAVPITAYSTWGQFGVMRSRRD